MAQTLADLEALVASIDGALTALLSGRVAEYSIDGRQFRMVDIGDLQRLRSDIVAQIASASSGGATFAFVEFGRVR
jgi:hypothetical protein